MTIQSPLLRGLKFAAAFAVALTMAACANKNEHGRQWRAGRCRQRLAASRISSSMSATASSSKAIPPT